MDIHDRDKIHAEIAKEAINENESSKKVQFTSEWQLLIGLFMVVLMVLWVLAYIRW